MTFRQLALTKRECKPVSAESSDWGKKMNTNYPRKHNERNYSEKWKKDYSFWPSLAVTQLCKAQWGGGGSEWLKQPLGNPLSISVCTKQLSIWNSKSLLMIETQLPTGLNYGQRAFCVRAEPWAHADRLIQTHSGIHKRALSGPDGAVAGLSSSVITTSACVTSWRVSQRNAGSRWQFSDSGLTIQLHG